MLDINFIREKREEVKKALLKRVGQVELDKVLDKVVQLDDKRKDYIQKVEELKAERNKQSKTKPTPEVQKKMKLVGEKIEKLDKQIEKVEVDLRAGLYDLPNIPADDVVAGGKENNKVLRTSGKKPKLDSKAKDHVKLATDLGVVDYERAAKMSGSGFWVYTGDGALLEWALLNYFIDFHRKNGYTFIFPPFLLNEESAFASGHLPKFREDLYWAHAPDQAAAGSVRGKSRTGMCLNATSEMMLLNYHRDEILDAKELPKKYFAYSACFRREAGSYRKEERGMIRGHQFNKIEMFQFTKPADSWKGFDELVSYAEKLVEGLGLHYQSVQLAAEDASAAMSKTIDIEVFIPSMNGYKEVSSISNALDYQARRSNIRYKTKSGNEFLHTLNASGLATSRLVPAILEQGQRKDGSVEIPEVLRGFLGKDVLK
ncbi:serine--tRNA ligase [Candidatus Falkowbacteria bacterium]|nr:serine--tRNA ligase [Candidatus Falkowbacteria bacterium]